jgi:hypothetical protein
MIGFIDTFFTITFNHKQFTITHNQSSADPFFLDSRGLSLFPFSLSLLWFCSMLLTQSRGSPIGNTSVAQQWICANHIEHTSCYIGSILAFTVPLHNNGSYVIVACLCLPTWCVRMCLHVIVCILLLSVIYPSLCSVKLSFIKYRAEFCAPRVCIGDVQSIIWKLNLL